MRIKDPTGRLPRWALQLQQHDFEIIHRSGSANANADALSRRTYPVDALSSADITEVSLPVTVLDQPCPLTQTLYTQQRQDSISTILYYISKPRNCLQTTQKLVLCYCLLIRIILMIMEFFVIYGPLEVDVLNHCVVRLLFQLFLLRNPCSMS